MIVQELARQVYNVRRNFRIRYYDDPELAVLVPAGMRDSVLMDGDVTWHWSPATTDPDQLSILGARVAWVTNLTEPLVVVAAQ